MRRPSQNAKQRQFAREQRALLALRRAAVRFTVVYDDPNGHGVLGERSHELDIAALRYANTMNSRDRRRLSK